MQDLQNAFSNDDPITLTVDLRQWWVACFLITSNLFAFWGCQFFWRIRLVTEFVALAASCIVSIFYHTCQTTNACFHLGLQRWTFSDHITADIIPAIMAIAVCRSFTMDQFVSELRRLWPSSGTTTTTDAGNNNGVLISISPTQSNREFPENYARSVLLDYHWTAGITLCAVIVIVMSTICHPYSMQNFIIVLSFSMCIILVKLVAIDNGDPTNLMNRISVPDLIVGTILLFISIIYFVLDSFVLYWLFHSLWHCFSNVGVYFLAAGITKGVPGWYSPVAGFCCKVKRAQRRTEKAASLQARHQNAL